MSVITSLDELRALYKQPSRRAVDKELSQLDMHCRKFVELSRFVVVTSTDAKGGVDISPRGGEAGFVKVTSAGKLLIPDWPGNNRLDTLSNLLATRSIGLIFFVPGVDEVLRVKGEGEIRTDPALLALCNEEGRTPKLVVSVDVHTVFLHCAKALMRSKLWSADVQVERSALPSMGQMLRDHTGSKGPLETQDDMVQRYKESLYKEPIGR